VLSVPDAIAQAIEQWENEKAGGFGADVEIPVAFSLRDEAQLSLSGYDPGETFIGTCPDCQSQLEFAEGCMKCHVCGYSECG
jgi:ribonucleoside-diphosphate reductase alpha chain